MGLPRITNNPGYGEDGECCPRPSPGRMDESLKEELLRMAVERLTDAWKAGPSQPPRRPGIARRAADGRPKGRRPIARGGRGEAKRPSEPIGPGGEPA